MDHIWDRYGMNFPSLCSVNVSIAGQMNFDPS